MARYRRTLTLALLTLTGACGGAESDPYPRDAETDAGGEDGEDGHDGLDLDAIFSKETLDRYVILANPEQPETSVFYVPKVVGIDTQSTPPIPRMSVSSGGRDKPLLVGGSLKTVGYPQDFARLNDEARIAKVTLLPAPIGKMEARWNVEDVITPISEGNFTVHSVSSAIFQGRLPAGQTDAVAALLESGAAWNDVLGGEVLWTLAIPGESSEQIVSRIELRCLVAEEIGGRIEIGPSEECQALFRF